MNIFIGDALNIKNKFNASEGTLDQNHEPR